jgi:hypothetical protein
VRGIGAALAHASLQEGADAAVDLGGFLGPAHRLPLDDEIAERLDPFVGRGRRQRSSSHGLPSGSSARTALIYGSGPLELDIGPGRVLKTRGMLDPGARPKHATTP